ncbi:uncharacterized protein LOC115724896 isoform X3 [Cannabis sativa]|uniref:uncharacterized protein LOC115724896 isoform X3 n=1 Tax=Cannabis sativa TaxID=3483 RepID=UPI0029CA507C|nr:uncharacterized protein LOC115724896 isoform X3 [Cannabis sativa]
MDSNCEVAMAEDISIFCLMQTKVALCNHSNSINHLISDTSGTKKRAIPVKVDAPKPKRAKISKSERNILILRKKCMLRDKSLNLNRRTSEKVEGFDLPKKNPPKEWDYIYDQKNLFIAKAFSTTTFLGYRKY